MTCLKHAGKPTPGNENVFFVPALMSMQLLACCVFVAFSLSPVVTSDGEDFLLLPDDEECLTLLQRGAETIQAGDASILPAGIDSAPTQREVVRFLDAGTGGEQDRSAKWVRSASILPLGTVDALASPLLVAAWRQVQGKARAFIDTSGFVGASTGDSGQLTLHVEEIPKEQDKGVLDHIFGRIAASNTTAADILSVKWNKEGDLQTLLSSLAFDSGLVIALFVVFSVLRAEFGLVYGGNLKQEGGFPRMPREWGPLSWISGSLGADISSIQANVGLDAAMLIEFTHLAMKICVTVGVPMCLVMAPANYWLGGMPHSRVDALSRIGMANIETGSWLYWVHAVVVWLVILASEHWIKQAMEDFLVRRWTWLKTMPPPRSTTVLVENLPPKYCSDARLREYFSKMFSPDDIHAAHVVRRTEELLSLIQQGKATFMALKRAEAACEKNGTQPTHFVLGAGAVDSITYYRESLERLTAQIAAERTRISEAAMAEVPNPDVCATSAFVTFRGRREAEIALRMQYRSDAEEFVMSVPPDPRDVRWTDLRADPTAEAVKQRFGYLCVIGLYISFMPLTVAISSIAKLDRLKAESPFINHVLTAMPILSVVLEGVLASVALTLFMSFLPTFLALIFDNFFVLKADAWAQHKLQVWYFWFLIVFILLVTAVGNSLILALEKILQRPFDVFGLLADSMPAATHFYLNFMVLQWVTHSMNLTRYMNLIKYLALRPVVGQQKAKELSEPEDQDYYGIGSRSARWTNLLIIGLVFSSLSPLIMLLALVNFALCRLIYGYLLVFAETRKPDLGGVFFAQQLQHLHKGLYVYVTLMIGVLLRRGANCGPMVVAVGALVYQYKIHNKFEVWFRWEQLPFEEIVVDEACSKRAQTCSSYMQPELLEDDPQDVAASYARKLPSEPSPDAHAAAQREQPAPSQS